MAAYRVGIPLLLRKQPLAAASCFVPRRHNDPRADRPWFQKLMREKEIEARKSLSRKIDDMFDLEPAVPKPPRVEFAGFYTFGQAKKVLADETNPQYKETEVHMCMPNTNMQEGIAQALWLTKSMLTGDGKMPEQVQRLAETIEIPDMEDRVYQSILQTRLYDTEKTWINTKRFGIRQIEALLRISYVLGTTYPELQQRASVRHAYVSAMFSRGKDLITTRGNPHGLLMTSKNPLPRLADPEEVAATKEYELPSFYPLAATIDLITTNLYKYLDFTGFHSGYTYPHAHTLFVLNIKYQKDHKFLVSRAIMFAHAHAVSRAKLHYGITEEVDLPKPIVIQSIVSDGVRFAFLHFQLNTLRHTADEGIKNLVWLDDGNTLYDDMYPQDVLPIFRMRKNRKTDRLYIKRLRDRRDPLTGCRDLNVDVYRKLLACYVHGAVTL